MHLVADWKRRRRAKRRRRSFDKTLSVLPLQRERQYLDIGATLQRSVQYVLGAAVEGDFVEFGTGSGFSSSIIARTISELDRAKERKLWLFDSFTGLPPSTTAADLESPHVQSGVWGEGATRGLSAEEIIGQVSRLIEPDRLIVREGWFADTVPAIEASARFGLVHVDGDLYESTMDCLVPLFERGQITQGAHVIFDDWNCNRADNRFGERRAWIELVERFNIKSEKLDHSCWAGTRFIIHSYSA